MGRGGVQAPGRERQRPFGCSKSVNWRCAVLALLCAALFGTAAAAKSPPTKVVVSGPGLTAPVTITDPARIAPFNPWSREFIAWDRGLVAQPPSLADAYRVSIYVDERTPSSPAYVLYYVPGAGAAPGRIYVPGPGDPDYRLNIGTIMGASSSDRWDPDGKWQYATAGADAAIQGAIAQQASLLPATSTAAPEAPLAAAAAGLFSLFLVGGLTQLVRCRSTAHQP